MPVKSAQILTVPNGGYVIDRIQNVGPSDINLNEEKIYEVGNFNSVDTVRGRADLSFNLESLDVSTEIEAILTAVDPTSTSDGDEFDLKDHVPINIISPFKESGTSYDINAGVVIPFLII